MQTFLPYANFDKSAECLDYKRLGKQRVEAWQILCALADPNYGWQNHPAVRMWRGYDKALAWYGLTVCNEWTSLGYRDTLTERFAGQLSDGATGITLPPWLGNEAFHASHRSNLLRKDSVWYGKFGWAEPTDLPYVWPV